MQTACRSWFLALSMALGALLACFAAGAAGNELPPSASLSLGDAARAWASAQRPAAPAGTALLQPTDPRVATTTCTTGWQFDLPFSDSQVVRARCAQPRLQIFLRASVALRGAEVRPAPDAQPRPQAVSEPRLPPASPPKMESPAPGIQSPRVDAAPRAVLTLRQDLRRGAPVEAQHVSLARVDAPLQRGLGAPIEDPATLEHVELVRDKLAGQVLYSHDLQPALLVRKGQLIVVTVQAVPGLTITARLEALQDGRFNETVRLRNRDSGRVVSGVVIGPNAARLQ